MTWILIHIPNLLWFSLIVLVDFTLGTAGILIFQNFMSRINLKHRGKILGINSAFSSLGNVIGPVHSQYGYHILKWTKIIPAGHIALSEIKTDIMNALLKKKTLSELKKMVSKMREQADIKLFY